MRKLKSYDSTSPNEEDSTNPMKGATGMKYQVAIVEDESIAANTLKKYFKATPHK